MIDLDELVYKLEEGDRVVTLERNNASLSKIGELAVISKYSDFLKDDFTSTFIEYLNDEQVDEVKSNKQWIPVVVNYGSVFNSAMGDFDKYSNNVLYAAKQGTWLFKKTEKFRVITFLFDKHGALKSEFPELQGIF